MFTIYAPNESFTGDRAGVPFVDGIGETDNKDVLGWFVASGYQVEGSDEQQSDEGLDIQGLTVDEIKEKYSKNQLKGELKRLGVTGYSKKNGEQLAGMLIGVVTE